MITNCVPRKPSITMTMIPLAERYSRFPSSLSAMIGEGMRSSTMTMVTRRRKANGNGRQHGGRMPSVDGSFRDAEHQRPQAQTGQEEPGHVETSGMTLGTVLEEHDAEDDSGESDREVDEEHPAP